MEIDQQTDTGSHISRHGMKFRLMSGYLDSSTNQYIEVKGVEFLTVTKNAVETLVLTNYHNNGVIPVTR